MAEREDIFRQIDLTRARTEAEWLARLDEIGDELGAFSPLGVHHVAFFADGNDTLLVSFESVAQIRATRADHRPLGLAIAQRHGWSSLTILARAPRWYRDTEVLEFFDAQIDAAFFDSFRRSLFYGAGMHGYAACAFSLTAPGATVLAIAPQATLDPEITPWERRFRTARRFDFRDRFGYAPAMLEGARNAFIVHDPSHRSDSMHATLFRQPFVTLLRSPRLGRDTEAGLERIGALDPMIEAAARGRLSPARFHDLMRKRRSDPGYLEALVKRAARAGHVRLTVMAAQAMLSQSGRGGVRAEPELEDLAD